MPNAIDTLFTDLQIHPVLMDIGATGEPPPSWVALAPYATYIGVGPASSPTGQRLIDRFHRSHSVEKIVTATETPEVRLHLMKDPIYSSLLEPNPRAAGDFLSPKLARDGEATLPAITIDALVRNLSLPALDWLHTNINGMDIPVFKSLSPELRQRILAFDSCMDLVDLCVDQQSGVTEYPVVIAEGFWLSRSFTSGPVKIRRESLEKLRQLDPDIDERVIVNHHRKTPGWIFVRFLRTAESLDAREAPRREYVLLWTFALLDNHPGFCADLLLHYERRFGPDQFLQTMQRETIVQLKKLNPHRMMSSVSKKYLPPPLRRGLKRVLKIA
jgi:hypothetical protein